MTFFRTILQYGLPLTLWTLGIGAILHFLVDGLSGTYTWRQAIGFSFNIGVLLLVSVLIGQFFGPVIRPAVGSFLTWIYE